MKNKLETSTLVLYVQIYVFTLSVPIYVLF